MITRSGSERQRISWRNIRKAAYHGKWRIARSGNRKAILDTRFLILDGSIEHSALSVMRIASTEIAASFRFIFIRIYESGTSRNDNWQGEL
jgi:hypothetical protein